MKNVNDGYEWPLYNETASDGGASAWFLGVVPAEVMRRIDDEMPFQCITTLASTNRAMWQAFITNERKQPYANAINAIRAAVQSDYDTEKTLIALHAINEEPPLSQPQFMRVLAEKSPGVAKLAAERDLPEWGQMVTRVETALLDAFGPEWRGPQLLDLRIANLHAQCLPFLERAPDSLRDEFERSMHTFPHTKWGDFFEVADKFNISVSWDDEGTFLKNGFALSRPPCDNFARSIGLMLLQRTAISDPILFLERIGVTETQIEQIIIPSCAAPLYRDLSSESDTVKSKCERWGRYADRLSIKVEEAFFLAHVNEVRNNETLWRLESVVAIDPQHLKTLRSAFVKKLECDTIEALGNDQISIDTFLENWLWAGTKVDSIGEWVNKFERIIGGSMPLVCKPVLLDRWALGLKISIFGHPVVRAEVNPVYQWLTQALMHPDFQSEPKLLCRMVVALIHALDAPSKLKSSAMINAQKQFVADGFETLPPAAWGWLLEEGVRNGSPMIPTGYLPRFTTFVLDPFTSASVPTPLFCAEVIDAAATVWERVPDEASGARSKFAVFCDRFAIPDALRTSAKNKMVNGIVKRALAGEFTLSDGLVRGGFDVDLAVRRSAHKIYRYGLPS